MPVFGLSPIPTEQATMGTGHTPIESQRTQQNRRPATAGRRFRQSHDNKRAKTPSAQYQEIVHLAKVSANFSRDLEDQYRTSPPISAWSLESNSSGYHSLSGISSNMSTRSAPSNSSSKTKSVSDVPKSERKSQHVEHLPSMLLPTARPRTRENFTDFVTGLRNPSIIAHDHRVPIILTSGASVASESLSDLHHHGATLDSYALNGAYTLNNSYARRNSVISLNSLSSVSTNELTDITVDQFKIKNTESSSDYLDNFADNNLANFRWKMIRSRMMAKERRKAAKATAMKSYDEQHSEGIDCPICAAAAKQFGGGPQFLNWLMEMRKPASFSKNQRRGVSPHFCNFVRKVRLEEKLSNEKLLSDQDQVHNSRATDDDMLDILSDAGASNGQTSNMGWSSVRSMSDVSELPESVFKPGNISFKEEEESQHDWPGGAVNRVRKPRTGRSVEKQSSDGGGGRRKKSKRDGSSTVIDSPPRVTRSADDLESHDGPNPHTNEPQKQSREIVKKERKTHEQRRRPQSKTKGLGDVVVEAVQQEAVPEPEPELEPIPAKRASVVVEAPKLPTIKKESKQKTQRARTKGDKQPIQITPAVKAEEPTKDMKEARVAFELSLPEAPKEDLQFQKPYKPTCLQGSMALSQQSCRFELPMDMKVLERLSALDYLRSYCIITARRTTLYQKIHSKYKDRDGKISVKDLERALKDVLIKTITRDDITKICDVLDLSLGDKSVIEFQLFAGIASMAERMLYTKYLTEDTEDILEYQKERLECADFSALEWKFHGVHVNPQIRRVLESL